MNHRPLHAQGSNKEIDVTEFGKRKQWAVAPVTSIGKTVLRYVVWPCRFGEKGYHEILLDSFGRQCGFGLGTDSNARAEGKCISENRSPLVLQGTVNLTIEDRPRSSVSCERSLKFRVWIEVELSL